MSKDQNPSGVHEYLQKYATSGCWKGVDVNDSVSVLKGRSRRKAVESISSNEGDLCDRTRQHNHGCSM